LANSRKNSGRCIAGKEILNDGSVGSWIRPVSSRPTEEISNLERRYLNGKMAELLDIMKIPLKQHKPTSFQTENHLIHEKYKWEKSGVCERDKMNILCDYPQSLWGRGCSSYYGSADRIEEGSSCEYSESLFLITPDVLDIVVRLEGERFDNPKRKVRARFQYNGMSYLFPVTDPVERSNFLSKEDGTYNIDRPTNRIYMCVSIGLPHDGYCYKFVASIIRS